MDDITWFGGAYLALCVMGLLWNIGRVGDYREPLTFGEVCCQAVVSALIIWGLFTVGVKA